eukprot:GGOE01018320.1.p1 GENE.GGOE01018320.1~~GGOE01018320.1.p1  ORF type:complete len:664 (+),score=199.75 GGOE01018320.1:41-1993(+)
MPQSMECMEMDPFSRRLCVVTDHAGAPEVAESSRALLEETPETPHLQDEPHKECPHVGEGVRFVKVAGRLMVFRFLFLRKWLRGYSFRKLQLDMLAGLTVGVIAIPQSMAYASLAGLPPIYGLYSCTVPLVMYGLFGSCGQLAVGPTAVHAMIIAEFILGEMSSGVDLMEVAGVLAFYSGILRICLGLCNMGFLARLLSHSVTSGFASAAGVMISLSQVRSLTGLPMQRGRTLFQSLYFLALALPSFSWSNAATLAMGAAVIAFLVLVRRVRRLPKWFPSQLIAMVACTTICGVFELNEVIGIQVLESIPSGLPPFSPPLIDEHTSVELYFQPVLVLTAMAFMECISLGQKFSQERGYRLDPSQELFALGMANTFGSLLSGFPVTGSFSRSMVNAHIGAVTPLANVATAVVVASALSFLMPCFYYLPKTCLAGIIISSTVSLIDVDEISWLWKHRLPDRIVWLSAFIATISLGVGPGVIIGVGISFAMLIKNTAKPHTCVLGYVHDDWRDIARFPEARLIPRITILRIDARFAFTNADFFRRVAERTLERWDDTRCLIVDCRAVNGADATSVHMLEDLGASLLARPRPVQLVFGYVKGPLSRYFAKLYGTSSRPKLLTFIDTKSAVEWSQRNMPPWPGDEPEEPVLDFCI